MKSIAFIPKQPLRFAKLITMLPLPVSTHLRRPQLMMISTFNTLSLVPLAEDVSSSSMQAH
jgi:hypothetical protein